MATEERGEYVAARPILLEKASLGIGESRRAEREDWARGPAGLARFFSTAAIYWASSGSPLAPDPVLFIVCPPPNSAMAPGTGEAEGGFDTPTFIICSRTCRS
jgi:hypothetical protein